MSSHLLPRAVRSLCPIGVFWEGFPRWRLMTPILEGDSFRTQTTPP